MTIFHRLRPELCELSPYAAAEQVEETIRLNANESPFTAANDRFRRPLNRYPQIRPTSIREKLARRFGCDTNQLLVTRGSSEAIDLLIRCFCRAGEDSIIISSPTFSMYAHYAHIQDAAVVDLPLRNDFTLPADRICAAINDTTKLIFICSPNNPTGTVVDRSVIEQVLRAADGKAAVVVDEAYIEFCAAASLTATLAEFPNLVVLRTLSKALGFAGARCGAVIAQRDIIRVLDAVQAPYAVATPVAESVEDALNDEVLSACDASVQDVIKERQRMEKALAALPFVRNVVPSNANFLFVRFDDSEKVMQITRTSGILLRFFGGDLSDYIRISIGTAEDNSKLLDTLHDLEASL